MLQVFKKYNLVIYMVKDDMFKEQWLMYVYFCEISHHAET